MYSMHARVAVPGCVDKLYKFGINEETNILRNDKCFDFRSDFKYCVTCLSEMFMYQIKWIYYQFIING